MCRGRRARLDAGLCGAVEFVLKKYYFIVFQKRSTDFPVVLGGVMA